MPVRDVKISNEVANQVKQGHGVASIPKDALVGLYHGLQKKFGFGRVADTTLGADPDARRNARRVVGEKTQIVQRDTSPRYDTQKVTAVLSKNASNQTQYLVSIDDRLRKIESQMGQANQRGARSEAESKITKMKQEQFAAKAAGASRAPRPKSMMKQAGEATSSAFSLGNLLKYGASVATTGFDIYSGVDSSKDWGVNPVMGGLIGMLTGNRKGGALNSISKAVTLGTVGGMLKGPTGALIGTIVGAVGGFIGGDKLNGFIKDFTENTLSKIPTMLKNYMKDNSDLEINKKTDWLKDKSQDIVDMVSDFAQDSLSGLHTITTKMVGMGQDKLGTVVKSLGDQFHLGFVSDFGDTLKQKGAETISSADSDAKSDANQRVADRKNREVGKLASRGETSKLREKQGEEATLFGEWNKLHPESKDETKVAEAPKLQAAPAPATKPPEKTAVVDAKPTSPTPVQKPKSIDTGSLNVGDVPSDAIRAAASAASAMNGIGGNLTGSVTPEALATIIAKESGGKLNVKDGDNGTAIGIGQMRPNALKDVNDAFGTSFTSDMLRDYKVALLTSALFLKLKLREKKGDIKAAFAKYNGSGPMAERYSNDAMMKLASFKQEPQVSPAQPTMKDTGQKMVLAQKETDQLEDYNNRKPQGSSQSPMITSVSTVNQNQNLNLPMPPTRNDDASYMRTLMG